MVSLNLSGKWKVREASLKCKGPEGLAKVEGVDEAWMNATVPGEIHLDLKRNGRMDEPLNGLNAKKSRWPEKYSWWFVREFNVPATVLKQERQELVLEGLDLYAQIFLNGQLIGEARNAFVPCVIDVRNKLKAKGNRLVVRLTAGEELVNPALRSKGKDRQKRQVFAGISHLRKPQFTYGWDWVDLLPNIGIWRDVRIQAHSGVVLHDVSLVSRIAGDDVTIDCTAIIENLHPWSERGGDLELTISPPHGKAIRIQKPFAAQAGRSTIAFPVTIPHPQLWWPNGMGEQPLYNVTIRTQCNGVVSDQREMNIGLRTIEIDRSALQSGGSRFCIKVNGQDVFCKGANWIPADAIVARVAAEKYKALISEARNANFNMLRIWGGGIYESPHFYEACDRQGILVWQDFMFACAEYPDSTLDFRQAVREEAEAVVRALRHHPSIALWCGNNENLWGFADWWNPGREVGDKDVRIGGSRLYNQVLPDVCRMLDPDRPYWPSSPAGGPTPNSETDGDCHWWPQGPMSPDINRRINHQVFDECTAKFVSEYGVIAPCHWDSIREYLDESDRHFKSRAWQEHTNLYEKQVIGAAIERHYTDYEGIDVPNYILFGQLYQALMYGGSFEALRFRKHDRQDDCQGALIWMFNDCWGETGWTPIDYYLRRKASFYAIRRACEPLKALVRARDNSLVTRVVNDTLAKNTVRVHYGWMRIDGTKSQMRDRLVAVPGNGMVEIHREPIPTPAQRHPGQWVYCSYLSGTGIQSTPSIWMLAPFRELATEEPDIQITRSGNSIHLLSDVFCHAVHTEDGGRALLSDNYFDLLPGVPKVVDVLQAKSTKGLSFKGVVAGARGSAGTVTVARG